MKMTPEERAKRFLEIQKHFERGDVDSIFNEQLKTLVDTDITIIDRISPRKTGVFSMIKGPKFEFDYDKRKNI